MVNDKTPSRRSQRLAKSTGDRGYLSDDDVALEDQRTSQKERRIASTADDLSDRLATFRNQRTSGKERRLASDSSDALDDLVGSLAAFDPFEQRASHLAALDVDRSVSHRNCHQLSLTTGGQYTVLVYEWSGKFLLAYDNIHKPEAYIRKIRAEHPRAYLSYMSTAAYQRKKLTSL